MQKAMCARPVLCARHSRTLRKCSLDGFTGQIEQAPPAYSAIKIDGRRAYDLARAGEQVEMAKRTVQVESLRLIGCPDEDHADFEVSCSKGTYVRSLARDMAT